jgi:hypothetical protein
MHGRHDMLCLVKGRGREHAWQLHTGAACVLVHSNNAWSGVVNKATVGLVCRVVCRLHCHKVGRFGVMFIMWLPVSCMAGTTFVRPAKARGHQHACKVRCEIVG